MQTLRDTALEYEAAEQDLEKCKTTLVDYEYSMRDILDRNQELFLIGARAVVKPNDLFFVQYGTVIIVDNLEYLYTTQGWINTFGNKMNHTKMFVHIMKNLKSLQTVYAPAAADEDRDNY